MSEVQMETIAVTRYAPKGANAIRLYDYNGAEGLTMAQLIAAWAFRRSAVIESRTVVVLNRMNQQRDLLQTLVEAGDAVLAQDNGLWTSRWRGYLLSRGCESSSLPANITSFDDMMTAFDAVKQKLTEANSAMDRLSIQLQAAVTRRDTVLQMSTKQILNYGQSCMKIAGNY